MRGALHQKPPAPWDARGLGVRETRLKGLK